MSAERPSEVEALAKVLAEHMESGGGLFCSCQPEDMHGRTPLPTTWETHLASAVLASDWRADHDARRQLAGHDNHSEGERS